MNKLVPYSSVPLGETFEYKNSTFIKGNLGRSRYSISGKPVYERFKKHEKVTWINAWSNNVEA